MNIDIEEQLLPGHFSFGHIRQLYLFVIISVYLGDREIEFQ
jgi:hypothetical protein